MKFLLISLILIQCGVLSQAYSQNDQNYVEYHQMCRRAESAFIDSNFVNCFLTYDSAFQSFDILFPRDCYLAAQLAFKTGYDSLAVEYLKLGVPFGINAELIFSVDTSLLLSGIVKSPYWSRYKDSYPELRQKYQERVDWDLKYALIEMVREDQEYRKVNNQWFNRNFRKGLEKRFDEVNRTHMCFLDSVFKLKGYPGIWLTGVGDSNDESFNNNSNLSEVFEIILYHYDSAVVKYNDFLLQELKNGHIHPRTYAMVRDFHDRHLKRREKKQHMYFNIWWKKTNYTEEEFNLHCYEIGCPTKDHLRKLKAVAGRGIDTFWWPFR